MLLPAIPPADIELYFNGLLTKFMTMYSGAVNSRDTFILTAITETQTEITVNDAGILPDPPNLLVIGGNSENAETVRLLAKEGNILTVERGFQCTAKDWGTEDNGAGGNIGALIARNFTEYDHAAFIHNIKAIADRMPTKAIFQLPITQDDYFGEWDLFLCIGGIHAPLEVWGFTNATLIPLQNHVVIDINTNMAIVYSISALAGRSWNMREYQEDTYLLSIDKLALLLKRR